MRTRISRPVLPAYGYYRRHRAPYIRNNGIIGDHFAGTAGHQFGRTERLGNIIVCAAVKSEYFFLLLGAGGNDRFPNKMRRSR